MVILDFVQVNAIESPIQAVCTKFGHGRVTLASLKRCRV